MMCAAFAPKQDTHHGILIASHVIFCTDSAHEHSGKMREERAAR